jgi:PAS domain S-box-containing protein
VLGKNKAVLMKLVLRYAFAIIMVTMAVALRHALVAWVGYGLPTYILFYPAIMVSALLGGFGPGLTATMLAGLTAAYWFLPPAGIAITSFVDRLGLVIFTFMGLFLSVFAELYRRNRDKAVAYDSQERYRSLFNSMIEGFCIIEVIFDENNKPVDYRFLEINPVFEQQTGLHDAKGKLMRELAPDHEEHWFQTYGKIALTGVPARIENEAKALNRWFDVSAFKIDGAESRKVAILFSDITARKKAEGALRQSEERLNFALEASHTGAWDLNLVDHSAVRSIEHDRIFGYNALLPSWSYGRFLEHVVPDDRGLVDIKFKYAIENKANWDFECRIRRADGVIRWIWAVGQHRFDASGSVQSMAGIVQDITERKQTEDVLKFLAHQTNSPSDEDFFRTLARYLGQALDMDFVCIDRLEDGLLAAQTLAVYFDGKFEDNISYTLKDTPCGDVVGKGVCCFGKDVRNLFPKDAVLQEMKAESYAGTTLWDSKGKPIGLIAVIGRKPLHDTQLAISTLRLVAVRAAGELERRQVEETLRYNEVKYRELVQNANSVIIRWKRDGAITFFNEYAQGLFGYKEEEIVGKHVSVLIPGRDSTGKDLSELIQSIIDHPEQHQNNINENICRDGRRIWLAWTNKPWFDADGRVAEIFAVGMDITESKRIETALQESRERLDLALNSSGMATFDWDMVNDKRTWSAGVHRLVGTNPETFTGTSKEFFNVMFPEDRVGVQAALARAVEGGEYNTEYRVVWPDGAIRHIAARGKVHYDNAGLAISLTGVCWDITESKKIENDLHKNEEELKKLNRTLTALGHSSQMIMRAAGETGYIDEVCKIIVKDCGYAMVWIGFAQDDEAKTVRAAAQAGFEEGYLKIVDITWADGERGQGPTGTAIRTGHPAVCRNMLTDPEFKPWREEAVKRGYASSIAFPLITIGKAFGAITIYSKDPDPFSEKEVRLLSELAADLAYGIMMIRLRAENVKAQDILKRDKDTFAILVKERTNELMEAYVELEKSKRLSDIGVLAATVAHELRNPLAAISMAAHNIKRKAKNTDIESHLVNINKKVAESDQIISNLLFYSRLKPPHYEKIEIFAIIEECIEALEKHTEKEVLVTHELDSVRGISIDADPIQIKEVLNNILNNAYDAVLPGQGMIKVTAADGDGFIKIVVEDNGSGIEKDNINKVFDPFFTTKAKGTGLGLSVCRQIVEMHNGEIEIKSEPGKGTSLIVRLPKK